MTKPKQAGAFSGHGFPPEIIAYTVLAYHRFSVSLRNVEDLLAAHGVRVSYETIRAWVERCMINRDAALCHDLFEIAIRDAKPDVGIDRVQDDRFRVMCAFEITRHVLILTRPFKGQRLSQLAEHAPIPKNLRQNSQLHQTDQTACIWRRSSCPQRSK